MTHMPQVLRGRRTLFSIGGRLSIEHMQFLCILHVCNNLDLASAAVSLVAHPLRARGDRKVSGHRTELALAIDRGVGRDVDRAAVVPTHTTVPAAGEYIN